MTDPKTDPINIAQSPDPALERRAQLAALIPEAFSEGQLDVAALKRALGGDALIEGGERYALTWAGKANAYKVLQTPSTATLRPQRDLSVNFDEAQHVFIEGENLEVLKVLQKAYFGKVKLIYIDPPYNTGSDSFIYPDRFQESKEDYLKRINDLADDGTLMREGFFRKNSKEGGHYHSNWLSMMLPRLYLARNLLREDGVIFVSCDDNEVHNLRCLMNEVFGEENFVASISWQNVYGGGAEGSGVKYVKLVDAFYEMRRFESDDLADVFASNVRALEKQEKTLFSHIVIDSNSGPERLFAQACEDNDDVLFYVKLPRWFQIETPVGSYNPDWALAYRNDKTLYFVAETKSTGRGDHVQLDLLRPIEDLRIECGKRHFRNFEEVRFKVVSSLEQLLS